MKDFLTDEEMNELENQSPDFISDEEMNALESQQSPQKTGGFLKGALEALPTAGALTGGVLGTALGPVGTVGGAGLGAAAGKALEQAGKSLFFDEGPKTRPEQYKELGMEALAGAAGEGGGQALTKGLGLLGSGIKKAAPKIGSALTGVPEQEIKTYAARSQAIKNLAKETDASSIEAADQIRTQFNKDIKSTTSNINNQISEILSTSKKSVDSTPIIEALENYKSKLNSALDIEQIKQIENFQNRILNASSSGKMTTLEANQVKQFLQDQASSAYGQGNIFQIGKEAANAAKSGAATARSLIDKVEPKVTELNKTLQKFHEIEDNMNRNLLKPGSPESALMAAGSGGNVRNVRALEQLGELTGTNMLEQAQNLSAMRTFTNPQLLPMDTTGKSATRMGASAALGMLSGGPAGAVVGGALTSPLTLKTGIETMNLLKPAAKAIAPSPMSNEAVYKMLMQKSLQKKQTEQENKPQDQTYIMDKVKGSPYEQLLNNAIQKGGKSFAAANYVLKSRDPKYRKLFETEEA